MFRRVSFNVQNTVLIILLSLILTGCSGSFQFSEATATATTPPTQTTTPTLTATPIPPTPTATPTEFKISSPLQDVSKEELSSPDIYKNSMKTPAPGVDDGHHGVDFAFYRWKSYIEMTGLPIFSVLDGKVAGVLYDRYPYGNALIIETRVDELPVDFVNSLDLPIPSKIPTPTTRMLCPDSGLSVDVNNPLSIYIVYAHMENPPTYLVGDVIASGQRIGEVGNTGYSSNAHLHFETRIGPSDVVFKSMAHYLETATQEEMGTYCLWRISGLFQLFDPMKLFVNQKPN